MNDPFSIADAKRAMVLAVKQLLPQLENHRSVLTRGSAISLAAFAHNNSMELELALQSPDFDGVEATRTVTISLVEDDDPERYEADLVEGRTPYRWHVTMTCMGFACASIVTQEVTRQWKAASMLARIALQAADAMPVITAEVSQLVDNLRLGQ